MGRSKFSLLLLVSFLLALGLVLLGRFVLLWFLLLLFLLFWSLLGLFCAFCLNWLLFLIIAFLSFFFAFSFHFIISNVVFPLPCFHVFFEFLQIASVCFIQLIFICLIHLIPKGFGFGDSVRLIFHFMKFLSSELKIAIERFFWFVVFCFFR